MSRTLKNIYKRKDGRWEARYSVGKKEDGTTKYVSVYGKTYAETKELLVNRQIQRNPIYSNKKQLYGNVLDSWLQSNSLNRKAATNMKYEYLIEKHIKPMLGEFQVCDLQIKHVNSFLQEKIKNGRIDQTGSLSTSYVRTMALIIQSSLQYAVEQQVCAPFIGSVCKPVCNKSDIRVFSLKEQQKLEQMIFHNFSLEGIGILLSLNTGMRIGEICALQWNDIDFESQIIHVRNTISRIKNTNNNIKAKSILVLDAPKTKAAQRDIPIISKIMPLLLQTRSQSQSDFVISSTATFVSPRTFEYRFHKLLDLCDIESVNFHVLRHTFATRCIENGVDVKTVSEVLGHSNVSITLNTYVHSSMDLKRKQLEKLN